MKVSWVVNGSEPVQKEGQGRTNNYWEGQEVGPRKGGDGVNMYREAIECQGAVNAGALVLSLSKHIDAIWDEARKAGKGTDYVNSHPVMKLFLEQMYFLCRIDYFEAYAICEEKGVEK